MGFTEYKYEQINLDDIKKQFEVLLNEFKASTNSANQLEIIENFNKLRNHIETMTTLVSIRNSIDTQDEFYMGEKKFYDENEPIIKSYINDFLTAMYNSKFKIELEEKLGSQLFKLIGCDLKIFSKEIIEDLQEENRLSTEYTKLTASAKIMFDGKERNLSDMAPFTQNIDRKIRKEATKKVAEFFDENMSKYDEIYDKLVKVRTRKAKKLGFENYIDYGYTALRRTDYNSSDVKGYRQQILENIVPISSELRKRQSKRIGIDNLKFYDESLKFNSGNSKPQGDPDWILNNGKTMYNELSPETKEFFDFMTENDLLDLVSKKSKAGGGYCTFIPDYKAPFIFSNFNGTSHDVVVLTHEAGHAFQVYRSRNFSTPEYLWPTYEACEIHSMSMEFLTWPWMNLFFEKDTDKFKFEHISDSILFLPYGATVDEFQHWVYENYDASPEERRKKWLEIENKYLPVRDYDDIEELKKGSFWFRQLHIFQLPFYYIDYTLAQICAFQFWIKSMEDRKTAWKDYMRLCDQGGSKSFLELVEIANLKSPFDKNTIKDVMPKIKSYLDSVDDSKF